MEGASARVVPDHRIPIGAVEATRRQGYAFNNGVIFEDIHGVAVPIRGRDGKPMSGALVEIWQSDSMGIYDHPRQSGREKRDAAFQGYGRMMADTQGNYSFRTLKPVAYPGRTPHIHLKVATGSGVLLTSQFYIVGEPQNERDGLYRAASRDPAQRARIDMKLEPANGLEVGALATSMDIVVA